MEYEDFYDLAVYANANWHGGYTSRELAINAYIYKTAYDAEGTESEIIKELLEQLEADGSDEAREWIRRIKDEK